MSEPEAHRLAPAGPFPNSALPVLVYRDAPAGADALESLLARHGWGAAWRNGVYAFHHYHSTAHEALGVARGQVRLRLGGPEGLVVEARPGTVLVLPAGTAHRNEGASPDLLVVGATDAGRDWDLLRGAPGERERALRAIAALPLPREDPLHGPDGPLLRHWRP